MVQLFQLDLLFQSGLLSPDQLLQSLRLHLYFHSVLVFLVSLVLLVFLVDQSHPVTLGRLEFLEIPQVPSLQLAPVIPVSLVYLVPQSLPLDQSDLVALAHPRSCRSSFSLWSSQSLWPLLSFGSSCTYWTN